MALNPYLSQHISLTPAELRERERQQKEETRLNREREKTGETITCSIKGKKVEIKLNEPYKK